MARFKMKLDKESKFLPSDMYIDSLIFRGGNHSFTVFKDIDLSVIVRCENQPMQSLTCGITWERIDD